MIDNLKIKFNDKTPVCIECASPIDSIYKVYKDGFIDIVQCVIVPRSPTPSSRLNQSLFLSFWSPNAIRQWTSTWNANTPCCSSTSSYSSRPRIATSYSIEQSRQVNAPEDEMRCRRLIWSVFKTIVLFKFLLLFLLCDAYLHWFHVKNRQFESIATNDEQLFYELEWGFYIMLINSILGMCSSSRPTKPLELRQPYLIK